MATGGLCMAIRAFLDGSQRLLDGSHRLPYWQSAPSLMAISIFRLARSGSPDSKQGPLNATCRFPGWQLAVSSWRLQFSCWRRASSFMDAGAFSVAFSAFLNGSYRFLDANSRFPLWQLAPPSNYIEVNAFLNGSYRFLTGDQRLP